MANEATLLVSHVGLSSIQETVFRSMLAVLQGKTTARWEYSEAAAPGILIVNPATPQGAEALKNRAPNSQRIIAVLIEDDSQVIALPPEAIRLDAPLRVMNTLDVLNAVTARLTASGGNSSPTVINLPQMQAAPSAFTLALREISGYSHGGIPMGVFTIKSSAGDLYFWADEKRVFVPVEFVDYAQLHQLTGLKAAPVTHGDAAVEQAWALAKPWSGLLWQAGLLAGQGNLLPWLSGDCTYKLRRWPDASLLASRPAFVRLSAHFARSKEWVTPASVAQTTSAKAGDVADFINACSLCGYLIEGERVIAAPSPAPVVMSEEKKSLFGRIRATLGL